MSLLDISDSSLAIICKILNVNPLNLDPVRKANKKLNEIVVFLGLDMLENAALSISCDPAGIINSWPFENDKAKRNYTISWYIRVRSLSQLMFSFWRICDKCLEQFSRWREQMRSVFDLHISHCQLSISSKNFAKFLRSMNLKEIYLGHTSYSFALEHWMFQQLTSISISLEQTNNLVFDDYLLDLWCKTKPTKVDIWSGLTNFTLPKLWKCIKIILFDDSSRTTWSEPFCFATLKITRNELSDFLRKLQNIREIACTIKPFTRMGNIISVQTCSLQYPNRVVTFCYHRP